MKVQEIYVMQGEECRIDKASEGILNESHVVVGPAKIVVANGHFVSKEEVTMEERFELVAAAIKGLKRHQWSRITQHIDMTYNSKAADVRIDDSELLKINLQKEFGLISPSKAIEAFKKAAEESQKEK
ncbi:hypothetical protein [Paenibacillus illinoisensis]